jgi:hypothetical protein
VYHLGLKSKRGLRLETLLPSRFFWDYSNVLYIRFTSVEALYMDKLNWRFLTQEQRKDKKLIQMILLPWRLQNSRHDAPRYCRPAAERPLSLRRSLRLFSISAMSIIRPVPGFSVSLLYFLPFFPLVSKWCLLCLTFCVAASVTTLCPLSPP